MIVGQTGIATIVNVLVLAYGVGSFLVRQMPAFGRDAPTQEPDHIPMSPSM